MGAKTGADPNEDDHDERLRRLVLRVGERGAAAQLRISRTALRKATKSGVANSSRAVRTRIAGDLSGPKRACHNEIGEEDQSE